jgi:hypothetical protein
MFARGGTGRKKSLSLELCLQSANRVSGKLHEVVFSKWAGLRPSHRIVTGNSFAFEWVSLKN